MRFYNTNAKEIKKCEKGMQISFFKVVREDKSDVVSDKLKISIFPENKSTVG